MAKKKKKTSRQESTQSQVQPAQEVVSALPQKWVTDGAWISGVVGTLLIIALAYLYSAHQVFKHGVSAFGFDLAHSRMEATLLALFVIAAGMVIVEVLRLWRFDPKAFIVKNPEIINGQYTNFLKNSVIAYLKLVFVLWLAILFYHNAGEYGYVKNNPYYQIWFLLLDKVWGVFLWLGLPYILITQALKYNREADKKDYTRLLDTCVFKLIAIVPKFKHLDRVFDAPSKKSFLGLLVKLIFAPIMTCFFFDQFTTLVNNFDYIFGGLVNNIANNRYDHQTFNKDLVNIGSSFIFCIDVGLAWCGYMISSRWVDSQTVSAEPTLLGWMVCLISYPPFRMIPGWFITGPGEKLFLQLPDQSLVTLFALMMLLSYLVYVLPTIWFGVRFQI